MPQTTDSYQLLLAPYNNFQLNRKKHYIIFLALYSYYIGQFRFSMSSPLLPSHNQSSQLISPYNNNSTQFAHNQHVDSSYTPFQSITPPSSSRQCPITISSMAILASTCLLILIAFLTFSTTLGDLPKLRLFDLKKYPNATCLDGTPGGHYIEFTEPEHSHKLLLAFEGGSWVSNPRAAFDRSLGALGSSNLWPKEYNFENMGIWSNILERNPVFGTFNRAFLKYCDGCSNGGNNEIVYVDTLLKLNHTLKFHGDYIVDAHLDILLNEMKDRMISTRNTATPQIVVSGCSAGGLASVLNTFKVEQTARRIFGRDDLIIGNAPCSPVFLDEKSTEGAEVYPTFLQDAFEMAKPTWTNSMIGKQHPCLQHYSADQYKCMFAQNVIPLMTQPVFVINSVVDSWSIQCILTSKLTEEHNLKCSSTPGWASCATSAFVNCTDDQAAVLQRWSEQFLNKLDIHNNTRSDYYSFLTNALEAGPIYTATTTPQKINKNAIILNNVQHTTPEHGTTSSPYQAFLSPNNRVIIAPVEPQSFTPSSTYNSNRQTTTAFTGLSLPPLSGAFLHTCFEHCEGSKPVAWQYQINGTTIPFAVGNWWKEVVNHHTQNGEYSYESHMYLPCHLKKNAPYQCNPTCPR